MRRDKKYMDNLCKSIDKAVKDQFNVTCETEHYVDTEGFDHFFHKYDTSSKLLDKQVSYFIKGFIQGVESTVDIIDDFIMNLYQDSTDDENE